MDPLAIVELLVVAAGVAGLASRLGVSAPLVLTFAGLLFSFVPGVPSYRLSPDLVLVGFLPPLLYATAIRLPFVSLKRHRRAIGLLSVGLVAATALAVAVVAQRVLPGLPFAAALALGAVVAPPDAVAATAVSRRVGMPRRVVTILEGESLLNDATALVMLSAATGALTGTVTAGGVVLGFVEAVGLGLLVGLAVAAVVKPIRRRVDDPVLDTSLSLLVPYVAYLGAERLEGSGVLAVVVAGLALGHASPEIQSASSRVTERTLWRTIQFVVESVVFLLIGLQLRDLLQQARTSEVPDARILLVCLAVLATVVVVRFLWMYPGTYLPRLLVPSIRRNEPHVAWQSATVVAWAGMRGVVTLAAAFSLRDGTPFRDVLVIAAFAVVAGTLLLQGSTLPLLARWLDVRGPDPAQDALQQAIVLQKAVDAGRRRLEELKHHAPPDVVDSLEALSERLATTVWERLGTSGWPVKTPGEAYRKLRVAMLTAERGVVQDVYRSGAVAPEVLDSVLERLDQEEAMLTSFAEGTAVQQDDLLLPEDPSGCDHLRSEPLVAVPNTPDACGECLEMGEHGWVSLRMCLRCGNIGCCDSSPNRHATKHFQATSHPVMRSVELGEAWRWCYVDLELG